MIQLSVVIISFNEEKDIGRCLESVKEIADEILVVDSLSTDSTPEICQSFGLRFISHPFEGYVNQKNFALKEAKYDHVLSLDADEALSKPLEKAIIDIKNKWEYDAYIMNRRNRYCGKWIRFTTLYPDRKLRLFDRRKGKWIGYDPHDHIEMDPGSSTKLIPADLLHWAMEDLEEQKKKTQNFAEIAARAYADEGRKPWPGQGIIHACWRFLREYIFRLGILEGKQGVWIASYSARYTYLKYTLLKKITSHGK
jgi:glycosyltransferase involved in cell wall biosynthesis